MPRHSLLSDRISPLARLRGFGFGPSPFALAESALACVYLQYTLETRACTCTPRLPRTTARGGRCLTLWHRRLDGVTETLRLRDPVKARCQSRKALECGLQVHLHASISIYISISHSSTDPPARHTRLSSFSSRWWLQQLGGRQQRGQLIGMTANLRVVAAVLARPPLSRTEAAERRS